MVTRSSDQGQSPWLPVFGGTPAREPVAPSKPAMPTTARREARAEPIDSDDAEVIAPVSPPPPQEIMPWEPSAPSAPSAPAARSTRSSRTARTDGEPSSPLQPASGGDTYRVLGDAAVHNASLSASGAPTPLGGVPRVPPGMVASAASADYSDDSSPIYTPRFSDESEPVTQPGEDGDEGSGGAGDGTHDSSDPARTPWWRSVPVLVVIGLLVMGGIGTSIYLVFVPDEEVELTPEVIVAPPETATVEPIAIEDPTDFQAAMPGIVSTYALTGIEAPELASLDLPVRAAEATILTYSDGDAEFTVRAIQHYDAEAAVAQFEAFAADGSGREPVRAGGTDAGERVTITGDDGDAIVWRNGTAVFELSGPADAIEDFYTAFPL